MRRKCVFLALLLVTVMLMVGPAVAEPLSLMLNPQYYAYSGAYYSYRTLENGHIVPHSPYVDEKETEDLSSTPINWGASVNGGMAYTNLISGNNYISSNSSAPQIQNSTYADGGWANSWAIMSFTFIAPLSPIQVTFDYNFTVNGNDQYLDSYGGFGIYTGLNHTRVVRWLKGFDENYSNTFSGTYNKIIDYLNPGQEYFC